ncbi:MAG: hypothetical protein HYU66_10760 [Armatimonadetes bacterium]|nr:hypothetical protein [Armatimonadota bacterium]
MNPRLPAGIFCLVAGGWALLVALRYDDGAWGRLSVSWPVPWERLQPRTRRCLRVGLAAAGLALAGLGGGWAARRW